MASISKLSRDQGKKGACYYIQFYDHYGRRRTTKGCSDKEVTKAKAARIEAVVERIKLGLAEEAELDKLLGRMSSKSWPHFLDEFRKSQQRKGNTDKYINQTIQRIKTALEECEFESLDDFDADTLEITLAGFCEENDIGHKTYNHYLQAVDSFSNWLAHPQRRIIERNPFSGIPRRNAETDVRRQRRALSAAEMNLVIKVAGESCYTVQAYDGETRARIYTLSCLTGFRRGELASLTPASFDLEVPRPIVTVEATASKHRRKDVLPLHRHLVPMVLEWTADLADNEPLFPGLAKRKTYKMFQRDLREAGIPYKTEAGYADFHACRHTFITGLIKSGATLAETKELARHCDVRMTMRYVHIGMEDQAVALSKLPGVGAPPAEPGDDCLHIVCDSGGLDWQSGASSVTDRQHGVENPQRKNPCKNRGSDAVWQSPTRGGSDRQKVEAAGIEPASRDISTQASTCVVD